MISIARRGALLSVAAVFALLAILPAAGNPPFKTIDVVTGVENPQGVPSVMKIDSGGRPIFAFFSGYAGSPGSGTVDVVRCNDSLCSSSTRHTAAQDVPADTSIGLVLDPADNPLVAFSYNVPGSVSVRVVRCADPACAVAGSANYLAAGAAPALQVLEIALTPGDLPAGIVDHPGEYALYWRCTEPECSGAGGSLLTNIQGIGSDYGLSFGTDGFAVASFNSGGLQAAFCESDDCAANDITLRNIDMGNAATGLHNTVEIHPVTGFPVFAYSDGATGDLKIAFCSDVTCVAAPTIQTLATDRTQGRGISLTFEGAKPVVASRTEDAGEDTLRWIRCLDAACAATESFTIDGPHQPLGITAPQIAFSEQPGFRIGFYSRESQSVRMLAAAASVADGSDVNCDGYDEALDAQIILRALAGFDTNATAFAPCLLDVNRDNSVDIGDALYMRQRAAGLIPP